MDTTKSRGSAAATSGHRNGPAVQITQDMTACDAAAAYLKAYSKERPEAVAMWAFGIGFVLGWKLRIF